MAQHSEDRPRSTEPSLNYELLDALEAALQYDYLQDKYATPDTVAGLVKEQLTNQFLQTYLVRRPVVELLARDVSNAQQVLLIGANGSGKTATLIALNQAMPKFNEDSSSPMRLIIFNGNKNSGALAALGTVNEKRSYILRKIGDAVRKRVLGRQNTLTPAWMQYVTATVGEFSAFNSIYRPDGRELVEALKDNDASKQWLDIYEAWDSLDVIERLGPMLSFALTQSTRLAIVIDNCDHLDNDDLVAAGEATADIYSMTGNVTSVIVAIRPNTLDRVLDKMNMANAKRRYVTAYDPVFSSKVTEGERTDYWRPTNARVAQDLLITYDIFERRLLLFSDPVFLTKLDNFLAQRAHLATANADRQKERRTTIVDAFRRAALLVLSDYFNFDARELDDDTDVAPRERYQRLIEGHSPRFRQTATPSSRQDLTRVFTMWHNSSVRELAVSLFDYILRHSGPQIFDVDSTREALATADADLAISERLGDGLRQPPNSRTLLFRHVFFHGTSRSDSGDPSFPEMHPSCQLYSNPKSLEGNFSFPEARILQFLLKSRKDGSLTAVKAVRTALKEFGVSVDRTDSCLERLMYRRGYGSGLVRIDRPRQNATTEAVPWTGSEEVEILPAGVILIDRLVYVIEFQYWSAVADESARQRVAKELSLPDRSFIDPVYFRVPDNRVKVAISYLADVLVPRLQSDHVYMVPGHRPSRSDSERLRAFAENFGFFKDDWHVTRCLKQVDLFLGYERERVEETLAGYRDGSLKRYKFLWEVSKQLDIVYSQRPVS
jgi:energy-coupling factor transporter ATP-binding protein EcfA2